MHLRRCAAALSIMALVACSAPTPGTGAYGTAGTTPRSTRGGAQRSGQPTPGDDSAIGSTQAGNGSGSGSNTTPASYRDAFPVGEMALSYIRSSPARRLVIEIDHARGREPTQAALDHLVGVLQANLGKPDGIRVRIDDSFEPGDGSYTLEEIYALEQRYRDRSSHGDTATMWIGYLDGSFAEGEGALGVAYVASAAAIFADQLDAATTAVIRRGAIERSVLTHEVGHLLGLVNIGYRSEHDHEDPDHPGHSSNRSSVMYWQVEDITIAAILTGGPPDDFDSDDRDDLRARREG